MITASALRPGLAIRFEGRLYRVVNADYHSGQGKMGGVTHARLKDLESGKLWDHSFRSELKLDELAVQRRQVDFLYSEGDQHWFMDPDSFEQVAMSTELIGPGARFLKPDMRLTAEFIEGSPIGLIFPDIVEAVVADTPPPIRQQQDSTWKSARLVNGVEIMVPPFIKAGDAVRVDLTVMKYMDRAKTASK